MILPLGTAGNCSWFIPHSLLYQAAPLQQSAAAPACRREAFSLGPLLIVEVLVKESTKPPPPSLHDPNHHPPSWLPIHRWLMRWSLPAAQHHHSAASHISWTTVKQIYLSCNYSAKTSKEQRWGPTVTPQILAVSPLSSSLYIFVPTFHLGLPLFGISGQIITPTKEQQTPAWLSACPWWIKASPHSLLSHSFQHHFITGKADKPVAAVFLF